MIHRIISCPNCQIKNRIRDNSNKLKPICGKCGASLFKNEYSISINDRCTICNQHGKYLENLSNGRVYHENCYTSLLKDYQKSNTLISSLIRTILGDQGDFQKLHLKIKSLHDFWLTYPPDWETRRIQILNRDSNCSECEFPDKPFHIHHRIPISGGGNHTPDNLVALCEKCHSKVHGERVFTYHQSEKPSAFGKSIELIHLAINNGKIIDFKYTRRDGARSVRSIKPEDFTMVGKTLCASGYCYLRNTERNFAVKRMKGIKVVSAPGNYHDS